MKPITLNLITQSLLFSFDTHPEGSLSQIMKETERYYPDYVSILREEYWELVTNGLLVYSGADSVQSKQPLSDYLDPCSSCGFRLDNLIAILPNTSIHFLREKEGCSVVFLFRQHGDILHLPAIYHADALLEFKTFCYKLAEKYSMDELKTFPVVYGGHLGLKVSVQKLTDYDNSDKVMIQLFRETIAKSFSPHMAISLKQ